MQCDGDEGCVLSRLLASSRALVCMLRRAVLCRVEFLHCSLARLDDHDNQLRQLYVAWPDIGSVLCCGLPPSPPPTHTEGVFSLTSIKASIESAVAGAAAEPEAERKRRIRQLQLRWHPGGRGLGAVFVLVCTCVRAQSLRPLDGRE